MSRSRKAKLEPWIEQIILNYSTEDTKQGHLRAHVVGVDHMSESQAQGATGPNAVFFLSDGAVHIPGILTQGAWETLQEQEDRECCFNLTNCTVCVYSYSLNFHMAPEKTRCRFFLSISELSTTAAGPAKDRTPCCTTLSSVREKICETWRSLLLNDSSVHTQNELGLSELLGEWMDDRIEQVKERVKELLKAPRCPQTRWAADRIRYKESFSVPASHLDIPEEQNQTPSDDGSHTRSGLVSPSEDRQTDLPLLALHTETVQPISEENNRQADKPALQERRPVHGITLVDRCEESRDGEMVPEGSTGPGVSPWDMFAPAVDMLRTSSSSDVSMTSEPSPLDESQSLLEPTPVPPAPLPVATSTQGPSLGSGVSDRSEDRSLPPYQRPHPSNIPVPVSGSPSLVSPVVWPLGSDAGQPCSPTPSPPLPTATEQQVWDGKRGRRRTTKRSAPEEEVEEAEEVEGAEEAEGCRPVASSLPTWLLESPLAPKRSEEGCCCERRPAKAARNPSNVHSDGTSFSYFYKTSDKILRNFSQIKVPDTLVHWAVKYLVSDRRVHNNKQP